ncbi:hypothetical protein Bbelb_065880 [Branchiostoma belcheri]|nr:hypothetical protein Bbelb_065880 [Branchiostoma belcheri]
MLDFAPGNITIEVVVSSADGLSSTVQLDPIVITPPDIDYLIAFGEDLFNNPVSSFYDLLSMVSSAEAFSGPVIASSIVAYLGNKGEDITEITDLVAENMAKVDVQDFDAVTGLAACILLVTAFPEHVSGEAQVHSAMSLMHTTEKLRELSRNYSKTVEDVNYATALIFTGAAQVFKSSEVKALLDHEDGIEFSNMLESNKEATIITFQVLDVLDDIYLNNMMPAYEEGDLFADIYTSKIHVRIKREDRDDSSEKLYTVAGVSDSFVHVPSFSSVIGDNCPLEETVGVQRRAKCLAPAERTALSRWTYRTLPQNVSHSPGGRPALSRGKSRTASCTLPEDVPHSPEGSPAQRPALSRRTSLEN